MRLELLLASLLVILAISEGRKNSKRGHKDAVHKHHKRHIRHKRHHIAKVAKNTKIIQKRASKPDNKQTKRMVSDTGAPGKAVKRSWICHPGCKKFCLPSCKASCCREGAAEYHPGMLRSIEEYQKGIEQNLRAQILEGAAPTSTDCGPLCSPSCAPICNSACCSANSAGVPPGSQAPAPYMYCGTDCSPNCGPICAEDCCAANSNPYDNNNLVGGPQGMQNMGPMNQVGPFDQQQFGPGGPLPQQGLNGPMGMNNQMGFPGAQNPMSIQDGQRFGGQAGFGSPLNNPGLQGQLNQQQNGMMGPGAPIPGQSSMQNSPQDQQTTSQGMADNVRIPPSLKAQRQAKVLARLAKKKKKAKKAKTKDGLACDPSCERLCLPSCKFLCCIPARFRNPAVADAANLARFATPVQIQQQRQQEQDLAIQQSMLMSNQGPGCIGKAEVCNPVLGSPPISGSQSCGGDCSGVCAPQCSRECCTAQANQQPLMSQQMMPGPMDTAGCINGCSSSCAPQCSPSCCESGTGSGIQVLAAGLQAIPLSPSQTQSLQRLQQLKQQQLQQQQDLQLQQQQLQQQQLQQQQLQQQQMQQQQMQGSCPGVCPNTCSPLCNARCCSSAAGGAQAPPIPGTQFIPPPPPPRKDCGSLCTSTCAPQCSSSCCSSGGLVDQGYSPQAAPVLQSTPQSSQFVPSQIPQTCQGGCPSMCAPDCSSSCCQTSSQLPPYMPAILQQIQQQIPASGPPPSTCPMDCPQQCAPQCTPQCCFPSSSLPPLPPMPSPIMQAPPPMQPPSPPPFQPSTCSAFPGCAGSCAPQCARECCIGTGGINTGVPPPSYVVQPKFVSMPPPAPPPPPSSFQQMMPQMPPPMPIAMPMPMPQPMIMRPPLPTISGCPQQCPSQCAPACSDSCCYPQGSAEAQSAPPERMIQLPPGPPPPAITCPSSCSDSCAPECSQSCCDSTPDLSAMAKSISQHCSGALCGTQENHWDKRKKIQPVSDDKRSKIPRAKLAMLRRTIK